MADLHTAGVNSLVMGSGSLQLASLKSLTTQIDGSTLKLFGNQITIGANADPTTKIGFYGKIPLARQVVAQNAAAIHAALVSLGLIT